MRLLILLSFTFVFLYPQGNVQAMEECASKVMEEDGEHAKGLGNKRKNNDQEGYLDESSDSGKTLGSSSEVGSPSYSNPSIEKKQSPSKKLKPLEDDKGDKKTSLPSFISEEKTTTVPSVTTSSEIFATSGEKELLATAPQLKTRTHYFGLKENAPEVGQLYESRSHHPDLSFHGYSFKGWHQRSIEKLKPLTSKVRSALKTDTSVSRGTENLLMWRIDLFLNEKQIKVENKEDIVWISGWPAQDKKNKLANEFPDQRFEFISSYVPNFERLTPAKRREILVNEIYNGYCLESDKKSFLIKERLVHQHDSLNRAKTAKELSYFNVMYLHTEQGLFLYLASKSFRETLKNILQEKLSSDNLNEKQEIKVDLVVNLASSNGVCINCADRMFRESEWGEVLLHPLEKEIGPQNKFLIKLYFLASACNTYEDYLSSSKELLFRYQRCSYNKKLEIGFSETKINFLENITSRQLFENTRPYIGHAFIN